ncbi:MAG: hypothetical protein BWX93_01894 [Bacteroidetes bacterium ADurb.Bin139]|nr:MAG: hypothetical protein BWX93_01894 [Bacteroidetes bacterium ADurb.Bin139]
MIHGEESLPSAGVYPMVMMDQTPSESNLGCVLIKVVRIGTFFNPKLAKEAS